LIAISSSSESKVNATKLAFEKYPEIFGTLDYLILPKQKNDFFGLPLLPMSTSETIHGAKTKAEMTFNFFAQKELKPNYSVGIEAGCVEIDGTYYMTAVATIFNGKVHKLGFAPGFAMPEKAMQRIKAGEECHTLTDVFGITEYKDSDGIIGPLTKGKVTRTTLNEQAVIMALAQIV